MTKSILVIGAVLLDIIGRADTNQTTSQDKIGNVEFAIGGVAFNVAINLNQLGYDTQLFTCLRLDSPISRLVKSSISNAGVKLDYIIEEEHIPDAAFMAIFSGSNMNALTSSPIDRTNILVSGKLKKAIINSRMVIADTNLSSDQIKIIHGLCSEFDVDLCLVSASDAKASRIIDSVVSGRIFSLVAMNEREARSLGIIAGSALDHNEICKKFSAQRVLLSRGSSGATYLDNQGAHHIPAPNIVPVNTLGAGDALFSAICSCIIERKIPYQGDGLAIVIDTVSHVLGKPGPNTGDSKITSSSADSSDIAVGLILVTAAILIYATGLTIGLSGVAHHWVSTIVATAIFGAIGTWIHNTVNGNHHENTKIVSGLAVGLATCIVTSLPSLAGGDLVDSDNFSKPQMMVHFISSTGLSLLAGLGLSRAVDRLISQAVHS